MARRLTRCPVCEGTLSMSELACARCQISIRGAFDACRFCSLPPEHLAFVELFLCCEGNLSRVEKELNISYPTARNRLDAALEALGLASPSVTPVSRSDLAGSGSEKASDAGERRRRDVLDALATGAMTAEQAAQALTQET